MSQEIFNWVLGGLGTLLGFLMKTMWDAVKDLQQSDKELADKVSRIEILVAGEYVKKDEFNSIMLRIFEKLDHIEEKIDKKVDR